MEAYNYQKLNEYILSLNEQFGIEKTNDLLFNAMNFQADNVILVTWNDNDINARESISKFICYKCNKNNESMIFLSKTDSKNIGRLGFILSPYYQNSEGCFKHSIQHIYIESVFENIYLNFI